jgi:hypothetical protein
MSLFLRMPDIILEAGTVADCCNQSVKGCGIYSGAFEMSSQHSLEIEYDDKKVLEVAARAISTSALKTSRPVKISHLYQLATAKQIFIRTPKVQDPLLFSMTNFGAAFGALGRCVEM